MAAPRRKRREMTGELEEGDLANVRQTPSTSQLVQLPNQTDTHASKKLKIEKNIKHAPGDEHKPDPVRAPDSGHDTYKAAEKLKGKRALITGGDSGIGRATAVLFAAEGADVAIVYLPREEKDAQDTKKEVEKHGQTCLCLLADLSMGEECERVVEETVRAFGSLEIVVNNCAYQNMMDDVEDVPEEQWDRVFKTNIYSYFHIAKYAVPHLQRSKGCSIINMTNPIQRVGRPDLPDSTSTKNAILAFSRGLSYQLVGKGVRVNAIEPGPILTPLIVATMDKEKLKEFNATPMGRAGWPSEIATVCVFLASNDSSFISGSTLHPNGGTMND